MGTTEGDTQSAAVTSQKVASFMFQGSGEGVTANPLHHSLIWRSKNSEPCGRRGMWVVLLGPDGAGKSAVIAGIASQPSTGFARCETYHLRPTLFSGGREANCDPHGQPVRGTVISLFKLVYLLVANWWGYLAVVRPHLIQGKLVLFDRYFPDCVVDPKRYRLPASCQRIAAAIARLLPQPDLYVVLHAPADVLQARKHEVTPQESERQRGEYAAYAARLQSVVVVDAGRPLIEVVREVADRVVEFRLARYRRKYEIA